MWNITRKPFQLSVLLPVIGDQSPWEDRWKFITSFLYIENIFLGHSLFLYIENVFLVYSLFNFYNGETILSIWLTTTVSICSYKAIPFSLYLWKWWRRNWYITFLLSSVRNLIIFFQIVKCICPNCGMYLSKFCNVFVQITKCVCLKCELFWRRNSGTDILPFCCSRKPHYHFLLPFQETHSARKGSSSSSFLFSVKKD